MTNTTRPTGTSGQHISTPDRTRWGKESPSRDDRRLLEGPLKRWDEFKRVWRIAAEFIRGFRALHFVGPCITVFGSARFKEDHEYYKVAREFGRRIAELGLTTMT